MKPTKQEQTWSVEIIRSPNRHKTVNAELKNGVLVIQAPAAMSDEQLSPIIEKLRGRLQRRTTPVPQTDAELEKRAQVLNKQYFKGELRWQSIRYVSKRLCSYVNHRSGGGC